MAGVRIDLPDNAHRAHYRVLYGDTDAGGVVYYGNYLRIFERGRTELMRDLAVPYRTLEDEGMILPVVESYCRYKSSVRYDDLVLIETALVEVKTVSCRFHYRLTLEGSDRLLATGFTVHAVVDRQGRLTKLPVDLQKRLHEICSPVSSI